MTVKGMREASKKMAAVLEVIAVRFALFPMLVLATTNYLPGLQRWQTEQLGLPFAVSGHVLMAVVACLMLIVTKRDFSSYGLTFKPLKYHLEITRDCFLPVVIANIPFGLGLDYQSWGGALIIAAIQIALLFMLGRLLKRQPNASQIGLLALSWIGLAGESRVHPGGKALAEFLTYGLFVGFGEEIIFRGYIQSRLNEAFGKPFQFFGVPFGWGVVIASALFGLTHVGIIASLISRQADLQWAWGLWTFFGGLVFGFVREKSGSVLAPALLHGLPQAIASAVMALL